MFDEITLINLENVQDDFGVFSKKETTTQTIGVEVVSVSQSEFYKAGAERFRPDFKVKTFIGNYNGEEEAVFRGKRYKIYRTFFKDSDVIELYLVKSQNS